MRFAHVRQAFGFFLFVISLVILISAIWPGRQESREVSFSTEELSQGMPPGSSTGDRFPEARQLRLDWPARLQAGGAQEVRLALDARPAGEGLADGTSVYDDYNILAESRLEFPGVQAAPAGDFSQPMQQGHPVEFAWQVQPEMEGEYHGRVWLYLVFIPHGGGNAQRQLLSVQDIPLRAVELPGLSLAGAQVVGIVGIVIGGVLCLDVVYAMLKKW